MLIRKCPVCKHKISTKWFFSNLDKRHRCPYCNTLLIRARHVALIISLIVNILIFPFYFNYISVLIFESTMCRIISTQLLLILSFVLGYYYFVRVRIADDDEE